MVPDEEFDPHLSSSSQQPAAAFLFDAFCRSSTAALQFLLEGSGLEASRRF